MEMRRAVSKSTMTREPFSTANERTVSKMLVVSPVRNDSVRSSAEELGRDMIEACRRGEREALKSFVRCYERRIFAYLSRTLGQRFSIEDLAQEVFLRAYPALARFESTGEAKLSTWLLSIAHRVSVDARRRHRGSYEVFESERHESAQLTPEERLDQEQTLQLVARAVEQLNPEQRDVFVLSTFHELSTAEIARVVGCFEATVKTRLFRARNNLKLVLSPNFVVMP